MLKDSVTVPCVLAEAQRQAGERESFTVGTKGGLPIRLHWRLAAGEGWRLED